jgi:Domain of unknown function (DUF4145)
MIIECPGCHSRVDADVIADKDYGPEDGADPYKISFLQCPECKTAMLAQANYRQVDYNEWDYDRPTRLWPEPVDIVHVSIPTMTRLSLEEASKCFGAQAYAACAVMCGRAIEAICAEHDTKSKNLGAGLKELKDRQIIDQRLFEWSEALRHLRNIGAHASTEHISREDARDVFDFALAICEYVFVLAQKYAAFKERQAKRAEAKAAATKHVKDNAAKKVATPDDDAEDDIPF